jgi:hypothetical protein
VKRSCGLIAFLALASIAGYFLLIRHYARPGSETIPLVILALLGGVSLLVFLGSIGTLFQVAKDRSVIRAALAGKPFRNGKRAAAIGRILPAGLSLCTSPFSKKECVAYQYEVTQTVRQRGKQGGTSTMELCSGFGLTPAVIRSPQGDIRLLGFPLLDDWKHRSINSPEERQKVAEYIASTKFLKIGLGNIAGAFRQFEELFGDEDGAVRKDLGEAIELRDGHDITEVVVPSGAEACAIGTYDSSKSAFVYGKNFGVPIRLIPGNAEAAMQKMKSANRSTVIFGIAFFMLMHAFLGAAYYMSSTYETRLPETRQADLLLTAVQNKDLKELERLLKEGLSPDLRDSSGQTLLASANDPDAMRLLLRYGADPNARNSGNLETALFDAARSGNVEGIRLLIQSGAKVNAISKTPWEHSSIDEAAANGREEAVQELVRAGANDPRVTAANGRPIPADGGEPLRVCRAYGEAILAGDRQALRAITTPRSRGFFEEMDLAAWKSSYPTVIRGFEGFINDTAATVTLQGFTADGTPTRWVYQLKKDAGVWKIHQTWPRE